jgi:hypothetical protein
MINKYPLLVLLASLALLSFSAWIGATRFARLREHVAALRDDYGIIQGATLTLLGLIIGFTFSMALSRYDQRKNYEEEEANAIGTEYLRAELLPAAEAARTKQLLTAYTDQRILYYTTRGDDRIAKIVADTTQLQDQLWATVKAPAMANPNALTGLVVVGMNDVINTQGYTTAAWSNRIPFGAWALMVFIAVSTTLMVGIGMRRDTHMSRIALALPFIISIAFFLISDIDSPRRGIIRVQPQNLHVLRDSMQAPAGAESAAR